MAALPREPGRDIPRLPEGLFFHSPQCRVLSQELGWDPGRLEMFPPRHSSSSSSSSQAAKWLVLQRAADLLHARGCSVHRNMGCLCPGCVQEDRIPFRRKRRSWDFPAEVLSPSCPGQIGHSAGTTSNLQKNWCYPGLHSICVTSCPALRCCFTLTSGWSFAQHFTPHQVTDWKHHAVTLSKIWGQILCQTPTFCVKPQPRSEAQARSAAPHNFPFRNHWQY